MNRTVVYWGVALAALIPTGLTLLAVGVTRTSAAVYSLVALVVVVGGWSLLAYTAVREQPTVDPPAAVPSPNGQPDRQEARR